MANDMGVNELLGDIGKDLKLTHIVALITTMVGLLGAIAYISYLEIANRVVSDVVLVTAIAGGTIAVTTYMYVQGIISGNYVNGTVSISGASVSGGPEAQKIAGITPSGIVFQNLSANDMQALMTLVNAGKITPQMLAVMQYMTPVQIQQIIQTFK